MLSGSLGVRLLLLLGETIPAPPPRSLTSALRRVQVTSDDAGGDGFQLRFAAGRDAGVDSSLIAGGALAPLQRVIVAVVFGADPEVLIDGVITRRELSPGDEPGTSTVTVFGRDVSQLFDLEERNREYRNLPDFAIAEAVLAPYVRYGVLGKAFPTGNVPIELDLVPRQCETDLAFLQRLAERNGFVFYVEPLAPGTSLAYVGPENRLGVPQPALTLQMGAATNVRELSFSEDALAPLEVAGDFVEPLTKLSLPLPQLPSPQVPPLALAPLPARRKAIMRETAPCGPAEAGLAGLAERAAAPPAVRVRGRVDTARYGRALRARRLVGVRGAGYSHDGHYYVRRVTHTIARGSYDQSFELSREGTGSLTPAVMP